MDTAVKVVVPRFVPLKSKGGATILEVGETETEYWVRIAKTSYTSPGGNTVLASSHGFVWGGGLGVGLNILKSRH